MPYRIASPPEPEPPEEDDPYVEVLRAQKRRLRRASVLVFGAFSIGTFATVRVAQSRQTDPAAASQREAQRIVRAQDAVEAARKRAGDEQTRFEAHVRDAVLSGVAPTGGACPVALAKDDSVKGVWGRRFPLLLVAEAALSEKMPSQVVADVLADVGRAEKHIAAGHFEEATLYARALDRKERFGYEVVLVAKALEPARVLSNGAFSVGHANGRAYVYEFSSGRVVCAADVEATSSKSVGYVYSDHQDAPIWLGARASLDDALDADLHHNLESAILEGLRESAPRE